jgi:hypothetical protein
VADGASVEESRAFAREQFERLLGLDEPDACAVLELAGELLGERRAARCLQLVGGARLTRRAQGGSCRGAGLGPTMCSSPGRIRAGASSSRSSTTTMADCS